MEFDAANYDFTVYNNTLYGTEELSNQSLTNNTADPFFFFNNEKLQYLGIMEKHILSNALQIIRNSLDTSIISYIDFYSILYYTIISIWLCLVIFCYFFVWIPFEKQLNQIVSLFILYYIYRFSKLKICFLSFQRKCLHQLNLLELSWTLAISIDIIVINKKSTTALNLKLIFYPHNYWYYCIYQAFNFKFICKAEIN